MSRGLRVRSRLALALGLVGSSAVLVSLGTLSIFDQLIEAEIVKRSADLVDGTRAVIADEERRVEERVLAARAALERSQAVDAERATRLATSLGLPILTIASEGEIVASVHLPSSAGDPELAIPALRTASVALAHVLVHGNPPHELAAIVARAEVPPRADAPGLSIVGGAPLDPGRLRPLVQGGEGTLVLRDRGHILSFGLPPRGPPTQTLSLGDGTELDVHYSPERLHLARRRVLSLSLALVVAALCLALVLARLTAHPITDPIEALSAAFARLGEGALDVRVDVPASGELLALVTGFNRMVAELRASQEQLARAERAAAWREAAQSIAHELKNPLFPMQIAMESLRKAHDRAHPELPAILDRSTQAVLDEVKSLTKMVAEFSEFARLPSPSPAPLDADELLGAVGRLYADDPRVEVAPRGAGITVLADRALVERALVNLVKNALEAGAGRVEVSAVRRGPEVELAVDDDGPGVPPEHRAEVFRPRFTTKPTGSGIGLALVERTALEHGGDARCEASARGGARFVLRLRAANAA